MIFKFHTYFLFTVRFIYREKIENYLFLFKFYSFYKEKQITK